MRVLIRSLSSVNSAPTYKMFYVEIHHASLKIGFRGIASVKLRQPVIMLMRPPPHSRRRGTRLTMPIGVIYVDTEDAASAVRVLKISG